MADDDMIFKVLLVGEKGTGKSAFLLSYIDETFTEAYISTIGVDFRKKTIEYKGKKIKLQIWDAAGQEKFRSLTTSYFRGCQGMIIVFDVTYRESFERVDGWLTNIEKYGPDKTVKLLVGNKCDIDELRCVTEEEAKSLALINNMQYTDASAKENKNVNKAFDMLIEEMYANYSQQADVQNAQGVAPSETPDQINRNSKEIEKSADIGDGDEPEWAKVLVEELCKMAEKLSLIDNIKSSVDTLCKKVEVLETKVNNLEKNKSKE